MCKFSAIIIAKEEPGDVMAVINSIESYIDEVILIYSNKDKLEEMKASLATKKNLHIRIQYALPLGLGELYKTYAESICRNDWIIALDTDERFNEYALEYLYDLAIEKKIAYRIRRKEVNGFTWQYRIWKKGSLIWRGLVHEHPLILEYVDSDLVYKKAGFFSQQKNLNARYQIIHNHKVDNVTTYNLLQKYQETPFKLALKDYGISILVNKQVNPKIFLNRYKYHKNESRTLSPQDKRISKLIKKDGITKIIGSDTEEGIIKLNKRYDNYPGGTELLIKILKDKVE